MNYVTMATIDDDRLCVLCDENKPFEQGDNLRSECARRLFDTLWIEDGIPAIITYDRPEGD
mgnify:CR=1 FL=1